MVTNKPLLSSNFVEMIENRAKEGTYRVNLNDLVIDVFPYVFPPQSPFSESSHSIYDQFGNLNGKKVLDIGTGTGVQAIYAALSGASEVDAVDIYDKAVDCARHNIVLNGLESKINVVQSDLFSNVKAKKYDLIIANLPIVEAEESDLRLHSLFDPSFIYHERLFKEASNFLSDIGKITLCHADLQKDGFEKLENVVIKYGFSPYVKQSINALGYEWRNYEFIRSKNIVDLNK